LETSPVSYELIDGSWAASKINQTQQVGPFKRVFDNHFMLVYGTKGTPEENAWALNKARFDAEQFYYRGNGSVDVMSDKEYLAHPDSKRNVVLYGSSDTNAAFDQFRTSTWMGSGNRAPRISVDRPSKSADAFPDVPLYQWAGDHLAGLLIGEMKGRCVAVVGGTDIQSSRLTDRLPYFTSGVAYPDWTIFTADVLTKGNGGIVDAGFFDPQGQVVAANHAHAGK